MDKYELRRRNLVALMNEHCDGKAARLAEKIGTSASYVSRMLYDETKAGYKRIGEDMAERIEASFNLAKGSLDAGEDAATLIPGAMRVIVVDEDSPGIVRIPMGTVKLQAGVNGVAIDPDRRDGGTLGISLNWVQRKGYDPQQLMAMPVKGESMEPTFYEGDTVVINLADKKLVDGGVYAINYEGEPVVKRMARDAGQWWMMSDNPDKNRYFRRACHGKDCIIIGRVVRREGDQF